MRNDVVRLIRRRDRGRSAGPAVPGGSSTVAKWALAISILTFVWSVALSYVTHFRNAEHLEAGIVEYRLTDFRDPVDQHSLYIDLALVNRGDVDARYVGSILYVYCPPGSDRSFPYRATNDKKVLVEPKSISGVELTFPPIQASHVRRAYAEAGLDTSKMLAEIRLEVRALDTHGRLFASTLRLPEIAFWEFGISWSSGDTDSLLAEIIPSGHSVRRTQGGLAVWRDAGIKFNRDGSVRNIRFFPDSTTTKPK